MRSTVVRGIVFGDREGGVDFYFFTFIFMKKDKLETSEVIAEIVFKIIMFLLVAGILILMFNELFT